jgi:hypothetical protein
VHCFWKGVGCQQLLSAYHIADFKSEMATILLCLPYRRLHIIVSIITRYINQLQGQGKYQLHRPP